MLRIYLAVLVLLVCGCGEPAAFQTVRLGTSLADLKARFPDLVEAEDTELANAAAGNLSLTRWPSDGPALKEDYTFINGELAILILLFPASAYEGLHDRFVSDYGKPDAGVGVGRSAASTWPLRRAKIALFRFTNDSVVRRPDQDPEEVFDDELPRAAVSVLLAVVPGERQSPLLGAVVLLTLLAGAGAVALGNRWSGFLSSVRSLETAADVEALKEVARFSMRVSLASVAALVGIVVIMGFAAVTDSFDWWAYFVSAALPQVVLKMARSNKPLEVQVQASPTDSEELAGERDRIVASWTSRVLPDF